MSNNCKFENLLHQLFRQIKEKYFTLNSIKTDERITKEKRIVRTN